jgi:hypothetical protein
MKNSTLTKISLSLLIPLAVFLISGAAWAHPLKDGVREIVVKANHDGFFDTDGRPLREIPVKKGETVRLVFQYAESTVDAYKTGNRHQFVVTSEKTGFRVQAEEISYWNRQASVELTPGADGSTEYRIVCILDCVGMENLGYDVRLTLVVA